MQQHIRIYILFYSIYALSHNVETDLTCKGHKNLSRPVAKTYWYFWAEEKKRKKRESNSIYIPNPIGVRLAFDQRFMLLAIYHRLFDWVRLILIFRLEVFVWFCSIDIAWLYTYCIIWKKTQRVKLHKVTTKHYNYYQKMQ